ncbi:MAG TPA: hypothetical protein VEJ84_14150, partial [Acidimicrobiales bacterium]|nr:hypothetical protein [Acidimicrobiales bacterium]
GPGSSRRDRGASLARADAAALALRDATDRRVPDRAGAPARPKPLGVPGEVAEPCDMAGGWRCSNRTGTPSASSTT